MPLKYIKSDSSETKLTLHSLLTKENSSVVGVTKFYRIEGAARAEDFRLPGLLEKKHSESFFFCSSGGRYRYSAFLDVRYGEDM